MIRNPIQILGFELFPLCHSWVHFPLYKFADNTRHDTFNDLSQDIVLAGILSRSAKMEVSAETPAPPPLPAIHAESIRIWPLPSCVQLGEELRGLVVVMVGVVKNHGLCLQSCVFKNHGPIDIIWKIWKDVAQNVQVSYWLFRAGLRQHVSSWCQPKGGEVIKYLNLKWRPKAGIGKLCLASQI